MFGNFSSRPPSQDESLSLSLLSLFLSFIFLSYILLKTMGCFSGCLMSSASVLKLFCGVCSVFKCSFDEIVGEKVVFPSYSSVILGPPLEKTLESPLECKEIKPVNPKGNQPWIFIGTTDAEAEAPVLWPPDAKSWLTGRDLDVRKDRRQEGRGTTKNEMVLWHHKFNGLEFEQVLGDDEGQGNLVCCSPSGQSQTQLSY